MKAKRRQLNWPEQRRRRHERKQKGNFGRGGGRGGGQAGSLVKGEIALRFVIQVGSEVMEDPHEAWTAWR